MSGISSDIHQGGPPGAKWMRAPLLVLLALVFTALPGAAAQADCSALKALLFENSTPLDANGNPISARDAMAACGDPSVFGLIYNRNAAETAPPVLTRDRLTGVWVNDYWMHVVAGLTVPVIETLDISEDHSVRRIVVRFSDPTDTLSDDPDHQVIVPNYRPVLVEGKLNKVNDGAVTISELVEHDVEIATGKDADPSGYKVRLAIMRSIMPDLSQSIAVARAGDVLVIRDTSGQIRTYRKFDRRDVMRAHALIMTALISGGSNWRCISEKLRGGDDALRAMGDMALRLQALDRAVAVISADQENAARKLADWNTMPGANAREVLLSILELKGSIMKGPEGTALLEQMQSATPFGCTPEF